MLPRTRRRAAREGCQRQRRGVGSPIETGLLSSFFETKNQTIRTNERTNT
nr:MAG TPA: hypothetical protein [Caudoviricetes sp.]